jgi:hypothetical protein
VATAAAAATPVASALSVLLCYADFEQQQVYVG